MGKGQLLGGEVPGLRFQGPTLLALLIGLFMILSGMCMKKSLYQFSIWTTIKAKGPFMDDVTQV